MSVEILDRPEGDSCRRCGEPAVASVEIFLVHRDGSRYFGVSDLCQVCSTQASIAAGGARLQVSDERLAELRTAFTSKVNAEHPTLNEKQPLPCGNLRKSSKSE